jgi:hypothetical protein
MTHSQIFSSGEKTGIKELDVKHELSEYIKSLQFPSTLFLQSCFFFENLVKRVNYESTHSFSWKKQKQNNERDRLK